MSRPITKKSLGQHYLTSQSVIEKITNDFASEASAIIEVGPGPAVLTTKLITHQLPMWAIEKDQRFLDYLKEVLPEKNIYITDALEFDFTQITSRVNDAKLWLVSNLPYNISVPLTIKFTQITNIKYMTLMFQKEVGEKILISQKNNEMNSLTALMNNYFTTSRLCKVPAGAFYPPPKVESIVISFKRVESPEIPMNEFLQYEAFLRKLFAVKRKQIGRVLAEVHPKIKEILESTGIELNRRAESLNQQQIVQLYQAIK